MLKKLLKYEIKATGRIFLPLYFVLIIVAITAKIFNLIPDNTFGLFRNIMSVISIIFYVVLLVGTQLITLVMIIQRFYKNLLGSEGYLMFTLPVKTWENTLSKLITAILWGIASIIVALTSIFIISYTKNSLPEIRSLLSSMMDALSFHHGVNGYVFMISFFVTGVNMLAAQILLIYSAIAIGHLFNKKLLASFGMYLVQNFLLQVIFVAFAYISYKLNINFQSIYSPILIGMIFSTLIIIASFTIIQFIFSRKLNLE